MEMTIIQKIAIYALPNLFAMTRNEGAQGWGGEYFSD